MRRREPRIREIFREPDSHWQRIDLQARHKPLFAIFQFHGTEPLAKEMTADTILRVRRPRDRLLEHDHQPTDAAQPLSQLGQLLALRKPLFQRFFPDLRLKLEAPPRHSKPATNDLFVGQLRRQVRTIPKHRVELVVDHRKVGDVDREKLGDRPQTLGDPLLAVVEFQSASRAIA